MFDNFSTFNIMHKEGGGGGGDSEGTDKRIKREPERGSPILLQDFFNTSSIRIKYLTAIFLLNSTFYAMFHLYLS